jgi:hypothetical protein
LTKTVEKGGCSRRRQRRDFQAHGFVVLTRQQHQPAGDEDGSQPRQGVDGPVLVRRVFGHFFEVARQRDGERHEHQAGEGRDTSTHHDEEAVPQLGLVDVCRHVHE